ncbi:MAG: MFS transporter [Enterococcus aquimarinus]
MALLFLGIIYVTFISLGLPDSLLGVGWPEMYGELGVPQSYAGFLSMTISLGTIVASFFSGKWIRYAGTGKVTAFSVLGTAVALFGFYLAPSFLWLIVAALPLGLGAGAVDAGLNDYVARHYQAHHMNWLHSFWGIGALASPLIMGQILANQQSWRIGYRLVSVIQFVVFLLLVVTLPMWRRRETRQAMTQIPVEIKETKFINMIRLKKVRYALYAFFFYIGVEATMGLWASSYLIQAKEINPAKAAMAVAGFFGFITLGRFLSGFMSMLLTNRQLIVLGQGLIMVGSVLLWQGTRYPLLVAGVCFIGFGCAPIYPAMLHETPTRFGQMLAQQIMGIQMAIAYTGAIALPPLFGFLVPQVGIAVLPLFLMSYTVIMIVASEGLHRLLKNKNHRI